MKASGKTDFDVIIVGGGVNGLTAAGILAQSDRRVLLLERRSTPGGIDAPRTFHPGFTVPGLLHSVPRTPPALIRRLSLGRFGLNRRPAQKPMLLADQDGRGLALFDSDRKTAAEIAGVSKSDPGAYLKFQMFLNRIRRSVYRFFDHPPPVVESGRLGRHLYLFGGELLRIGGKDVTELIRALPMSAHDWLDEWFETDLLKGGLIAPALFSVFTGPQQPGTAANVLLSAASNGIPPAAGFRDLPKALARAAVERGAVLQTEAEVVRIHVADNRVKGVETKGGASFDAKVVLAACDSRRTLTELVRPPHLPARLFLRMNGYRGRGSIAKVHLAMEGLPKFSAAPRSAFERTLVTGGVDRMEAAFDAATGGMIPEHPILDVYTPSIADPSLAPSGKSAVSVLVYPVPPDPPGGWTDEARARLTECVNANLSTAAPGMESRILARETLTPADLSAVYGLVSGHPAHGEESLDQLMDRPVPECARYQTPIGGLFLCGGGVHPGRFSAGGSGMLAAAAIMSAKVE